MRAAEPAADTLRPRLHRVRARQRETADTVSLELVAPHDRPAAFAPGQFHMLYAFGVGEAAISISRGTGDALVHTIREVGPVSRALAALQVGDMLGVRGPYGRGWPMAEARDRDLLLIAGGLGLAPLRPALDAALAERAAYRRIALLVGAREPGQLLWPRALHEWGERSDLQVQCSVDHGGADWSGHVGVVTSLLPRVDFDPARSVAMVCGPDPMMRFCAQALGAAGVPQQAVHLSMERNMQCGVGWCGHCQFGPTFVCRDGPVMRLDRIARWLTCKEA